MRGTLSLLGIRRQPLRDLPGCLLAPVQGPGCHCHAHNPEWSLPPPPGPNVAAKALQRVRYLGAHALEALKVTLDQPTPPFRSRSSWAPTIHH